MGVIRALQPGNKKARLPVSGDASTLSVSMRLSMATPALQDAQKIRRQGQCLVQGKSFREREKNLLAGLLSRDFLSSRA
jgi:hypothetical protein